MGHGAIPLAPRRYQIRSSAVFNALDTLNLTEQKRNNSDASRNTEGGRCGRRSWVDDERNVSQYFYPCRGLLEEAFYSVEVGQISVGAPK